MKYQFAVCDDRPEDSRLVSRLCAQWSARTGAEAELEIFPSAEAFLFRYEENTQLGREVYLDGVEISGGQTQRLMLARALYKNAPVVVLDEPTAALDPIAESDLYQKYSDLTGNRTSVYISHRLASTRFCDRVLLIENGGIAEEGTHEELLARGGTPICSTSKANIIRKGRWRMNKRKEARLSFREAMAYSWRGFLLWWKAAPEIILSAAAQRAVTALAPYLPLYFTARLVNAIAAGAAPDEVWRTLALLLASTAAAGAAQAAVNCWDNTMQDSHQWPTWNRFFFEKLLSMDFCDVDDPQTQALLTETEQLRNWSGWGLTRVYMRFAALVGAVFRILGAAALSVSLFTMPVPQGSPLAWLNHPLCLAGMAALMVLSVLAASALANKSNSYWASFDGTAGNRIFGFYGFIAISERQRGTDIRVYEQDRFIEKRCSEE